MSVNPDIESSQNIIIWDENEQFSVVNLVPDVFRENMLKRRAEEPEFFRMDEDDLWKELSRRQSRPTPTDNRLRLKFWMEYDNAMASYSKINLKSVVAGVCAYDFFLNYFMKRPHRVAWMLLPPVNYSDRMVEALNFGLDKMREIMNLPIQDENGKVDHKTAAMKIAIYKMLDDRSNGVAVQRLESKSIEVRASVKSSELRQITALAESMSVEKLRQSIADNKKSEKKVLNLAKLAEKIDSNNE